MAPPPGELLRKNLNLAIRLSTEFDPTQARSSDFRALSELRGFPVVPQILASNPPDKILQLIQKIIPTPVS